MSRSWGDVQGLLDDPYVSADTKEALLAAYIRENHPYTGEDDLPSEVADYLDGTKAEYNLSGGDVAPTAFGITTDDLYEQAQDESEEAGYSAGLVRDEVDQNTSTLDGMQAPTSATSGVEKSDELFDLARPALRVFEDFIPVNDEVPGDSLGRHGRISMEEIRTRYDEQMGINFRKFLADAERLRAAHETLSGLHTTTETELNTVYREWTGPAANASYQYYSEQIVPNSSDLIGFLSATPDTITTLVENLFAECKYKADTVLGLYSPTCGSATPEMAGKVVSLANGDIGDDDHDRILEVAAWVDSVCGSNLEQTIRSDDCDLNSENKEYVQRECKAWIRNSFNPDLHDNLYQTFDQTCKDTVEAVNSYYEELNSYLAEYENKFGPPLQQQQGQPDQSGSDSGGGPGSGGGSGPGSGGGPGPGSGGGSGPGGGGAPSPAPSMPPTPEMPETPEPPSAEDPSAPGGPGELTPTTPTTPGEPETVTIDDGEREISVSSPDGQGQVTVTVDDGSGQPKTYTLDFGAGEEGAAGATPGAPGTPGALPGAGVPAGEARAIAFGPEGGAGNRPPGLDEPIRPGPDGKCVIQDGDLTITAERPEGSTDTVKVTVDDGTGKPVTYDLDYSGEDGPTATQRPELRAVPLPGLPDGAEIRPAGPGGLPDPRGQLDGDDREPIRHAVGGPGGQFADGDEREPVRYAVSGPSGAPEPGQFAGGPGGLPDPRGQFAEPGGPPDQRGQFAPQPAIHYGQTDAQASPQGASSSFFADPEGNNAGRAGAFVLPESSEYVGTPSHTPGEAGLASASDDQSATAGSGHSQPADNGQGAPGGMPMMGGGAGGGAGGGDQGRTAGQWRTTGDLFDDVTDAQVRGAFGEGSR